jgi:hypothetical protein
MISKLPPHDPRCSLMGRKQQQLVEVDVFSLALERRESRIDVPWRR